MSFKEEIKINNQITELRVECPKCKHKTFIAAYQDEKMCYWCGTKLKNNTKMHFMYKMRKLGGKNEK